MMTENVRVVYPEKYAGIRAMWVVLLFMNAMNVLTGAASHATMMEYCALSFFGLIVVGWLNWSD